MSYQNYEDYMRSVLGYSPYVKDEYTYDKYDDSYNYYDTQTNRSNEKVTELYPEIYKIIYPMVCKICNINSGKELTKELLGEMTDEIYKNIEPDDQVTTNVRTQVPLKNGDVRNPNAKETEFSTKETRQINFLLRDLIKILLLREWIRPNRPSLGPQYPPPRPPYGPPPRPSMGPRYY